MFQQAQRHLQKDHQLSTIIQTIQIELPNKSSNLFLDLTDAIISQQLSVKAAKTIFNRFLLLFPALSNINPTSVLRCSEEALRGAGLSYQKISYLRSLSENLLNGNLSLENLDNLTDEDVVAELTKVKGIGPWTAEMFLIFSLARPDVFSEGDLGLRNAISRIYNIDRNNLEIIREIAQKWSPYRSIASLYLWKSLDNT